MSIADDGGGSSDPSAALGAGSVTPLRALLLLLGACAPQKAGYLLSGLLLRPSSDAGTPPGSHTV